MTDEDTIKEPKENLLRGGDPSVGAGFYMFADTATRIFSEAVDIKKENGSPGHNAAKVPSHNPTKKFKLGVGMGFAAASGIQTFEDIADGNYSDASFHGAQTVAIASTSVPVARKALGRGIMYIPGVSDLAGKAVDVSKWIHEEAYKAGTSLSSAARTMFAFGTKTTQVAADLAEDAVPVIRQSTPLMGEVAEQTLKKLPVVGPMITLAMGSVAAGARASHGDTKGAGGELVVAVAGATAFLGVMAATTVASGLCGPFAAACAAATIPAATGVAFLASEAASEAAARMYNYANGTDVNGSAMVVLGKFAAKRIPALVDNIAESSTPAGLAARSMQLAYRHADDLVDYAYKGISSWFEEEPDKPKATKFTISQKALDGLEKAGWTKRLDKNGDGELSVTEVNAAFKKYGIKASQVEDDKVGTAGYGKLDSQEISSALNDAKRKSGRERDDDDDAPSKRKPSTTSKRFTISQKALDELEKAGWTKRLDKNGDGQLSVAEVNAAFKKYGIKASQVEDDKVGTAGYGKLDSQEISSALNDAKRSRSSGRG